MKKIIIIFLLATCSSFSQTKDVVSFFRGAEGVQYFVKPVELGNSETKNTIEIDFLFSIVERKVRNISSNFSAYNNSEIKDIQIGEIVLSVSKLFDESLEDEVHSRYTMPLELKQLKILLSDSGPISINGKMYLPSKKTTKKLQDIYKKLLFKVTE